MEEIRKVLLNKTILTYDQLRYLLYLLCRIYNIATICLEENRRIKTMMAYDLERNIIYINPDEIEKCIDNNKSLSTNYLLLFALIHEINHALQKIRISAYNDYISYVYSICFSYIDMSSLNLISELRKAIYLESHDLFPTEVNADVMSHLKMLEILKDFDKGYYDIYKYLLRDRLLRLHSNDTFSDFCNSVLGIPDNNIYSLEECLILGLPIKEIPLKEEDIVKLIK